MEFVVEKLYPPSNLGLTSEEYKAAKLLRITSRKVYTANWDDEWNLPIPPSINPDERVIEIHITDKKDREFVSYNYSGLRTTINSDHWILIGEDAQHVYVDLTYRVFGA